MTMKCAYDEEIRCARLTFRGSEEEGGYEEAAYHPDTGGQEEGHIEEGLLYQPLGAIGEGANRTDSQAIRLCSEQSDTKVCAKNVLSLGEFLGGVQHDAETVGKWVKGTVHKIVYRVAHALGFRGPSSHDAACAAAGVGVAFALKDSPFAEAAAAGFFSALGCSMVGN